MCALSTINGGDNAIVSPVLGALSDRFGRRPVLLGGLALRIVVIFGSQV